MSKRILALLATSLLVLALAGCNAPADNGEIVVDEVVVEEEVMEEELNIVETAISNESFSTLVTAIEAAGLADTLASGEYTVFAPTNEAFDALPEGTLDSLLADPDALANVLLYHVAEGSVMAETVVGLESVTTLQGGELAVTVDGDTVTIGDATVTVTDVKASNGVIHVIDTVLVPAN